MLNKLADNPGANKKPMRVGRGIGSGKGKTAGRGVKGYKARSGSSVKGFEGGQMPLHMRLPKRGFKNPMRIEVNTLNLCRIQKLLDAKKIEAGVTLTKELMAEVGLIRTAKKPLKLLAAGDLSAPVTIEVDYASAQAVEKVVAKGGQVNLQSTDKK